MKTPCAWPRPGNISPLYIKYQPFVARTFWQQRGYMPAQASTDASCSRRGSSSDIIALAIVGRLLKVGGVREATEFFLHGL